MVIVYSEESVMGAAVSYQKMACLSTVVDWMLRIGSSGEQYKCDFG
jgi:hypothetical protein